MGSNYASDTSAWREEFSAFVGDIAPEVTDAELLLVFQSRYASVFGAKVVKGFGFVRFSNEGERDRAIGEMQGFMLADRPLRMSLATAKRGRGPGGPIESGAINEASLGDTDPNNTTLFIGGVAATVTDAELSALFARFGQIVYVRIPPGKGCAFVQYTDRTAAVLAMQTLHGHSLQGAPIRISWGKNSSKPSQPAAPVDPNAGHYHSHDGSWGAHAHAQAPHDYSYWAGYGYGVTNGGWYAGEGWEHAEERAVEGVVRVQSMFGTADPRHVDVSALNARYIAMMGQRWQPNVGRLAFLPSQTAEQVAGGLKGAALSSIC